MMKIIAGIARGIPLNVPRGLKVRPTAGRARKALFDSLGDFSGKSVVDLFAGSGALGLEAASRGAAQVSFIEKEAKFCRNIEDNIAKISKAGCNCQFEIHCHDASRSEIVAACAATPDIVFADPPYPISGNCFRRLGSREPFAKWLGDGILIWELPDSGDPDGTFLQARYLRLLQRRKFGGTTFLFATAMQ